jgi:hypothetical protein
MKARRWKLSSAQVVDMWNRWKAGQSLHAIGRALGKDQHVIYFLLARHGGIAPRARRRSPVALMLAEREEISRGIASGQSLGAIAQHLHRAVSTVSREVARHGGRSQYRASEADSQAWESALRPKPCRLATHRKLQQMVASKLMQDWSPQQVSGWLKMEYPNDFPVTGDGAIFDFGWPFANGNGIDDPALRVAVNACVTRAADPPLGSQMPHQFLFQRSPRLYEQTAIDGFVRHAQALRGRQ